MREIIFRGNTINPFDGWVYGSLLIMKDKETEELSYFIQGEDGNKNRVIPESIGQFTGLMDKDGNDIFEGDILEGGLSKNGLVTFENGTFTIWETPLGWDVEDLPYEEIPCVSLPELWAKVIGNVYENPELLTNKTKTV